MTRRQEQLLNAIIKEFIETANAVGSVSLTDKYRFNVSPATVRNEMAELVKQGYLQKPHTSAGRVPTTSGLRFFLQQLIEDLDDLDVVTREEWKQEMHRARFEQESMIRNALQFLTEVSGNATIAIVDQQVFYAGLSDIFAIPEFQDLENLRKLMVVLEDFSTLSEIFARGDESDDVKVLLGEETGVESFEDYAVVFSNIKLHGGRRGYIAVLGPNRMPYSRIIPAVRFVSKTVSDMVKGW